MVKAWREIVSIPTYEVGKPEMSPMFLEKRVYQGSSGVVYPYPVIESIADEPTPHDWNVVWLENEYIKVMVMPELGGRIQMAYDKIAGRHFVYYNHVIKPALVGLLGPWISGGIEFNWPQHHRPTTYMPADTCIEENEDGSVTVWVSETEKMFHQKGMAGFTLRPGCAYLEIKGRVYNGTDLPQTFLWWANPAVEVNDDYQSVFPPDINAVFDHGKRAVSSFPIATGTYYKMDYSAGVDISNYKNIKVPTSYMGVNSRFNFEGGYENDSRCGMLHVASHHLSPGKKQWTWGNGDFGRAWDRNLTDKDEKGRFRPYIELMAGVYTENQPDFSWLMPYEEKHFTQYFMPYRELGVVKEASKDLMMNISQKGSETTFKVFATSRQQFHIVLRGDEETIYYDKELTLSPEEVLTETVETAGARIDELSLYVMKTLYGEERVVLSWHAESDEVRPIPDSAEAALPAEQVKTNEQLYLTGLHLEQYRHATWSATDYYEEALRRDPNDIRCLNQLGLWFLRRGRFSRAESYLRKAVRLAQKRNPNPYDSEPIYNLALALKYQGRRHEAYELFWKATWTKAQADAAYFEAAKISVGDGRLDDALDELERCLLFGAHNHKALALKASVLRKMGRKEAAALLCKEALKNDLFNYGCRYELYLLTSDQHVLDELTAMLQRLPKNYDELALDYSAAGLWHEARHIWQLAMKAEAVTPMTYYYQQQWEKAEQTCPDYCFPNRNEDVIALEQAKRMNPTGAKAPYYLGCLYYAARQYDLAIANWELSAQLDPLFPTVWRNLALARFNNQGGQANASMLAAPPCQSVLTDCPPATPDGEASKQNRRHEEALEYMERAFSLAQGDSRMLMELDQLYRRLQKPHQFRLDHLQKYPELIEQRNDLVLEEITLLNQTGRYEEAMDKLDSHTFHPWEGGEGKVSTQYQICRVELAKMALGKGEADKAIALLNQCLVYPSHLGEGKLYGAQENDFYYLLGMAYDMKGEGRAAIGHGQADLDAAEGEQTPPEAKARECYSLGTQGPTEPAAAMYYNDAKPDKIFYAALSYRRLGLEDKARSLLNRLVGYGKQHLFDHVVNDYFAVSLPDMLIWDDSLHTKNQIHCKYMLALGYYGLGYKERALCYLDEVEQLDCNHYGTQAFRSLLSLIEGKMTVPAWPLAL